MRLRLPYRRVVDVFGGAYEFVPCEVMLGSTDARHLTESFPAVVDSGASRCTFDSALAYAIGLDLQAGRREQTTGVGGEQTVWIHTVRLFVGSSVFGIEAAFSHDLPSYGLLGMEGFFEHFVVTFDPLARECQLDRIYRA